MKKWKNQLYDQIMFGDVMQDFFSSRFFFFNPLYVYDMMFQNDRSTIFLSVQWYTGRGTFLARSLKCDPFKAATSFILLQNNCQQSHTGCAASIIVPLQKVG